MAKAKKKVTKKAAKKVTKKVAVKKVETLPALQEATLSSAALAQHANYDLETFKDVKLDVAEDGELFKNDILIPKVQLVQAMSEFRKEKKADEGQFVDSQTAELFADLDEVLNFIVLKTFKRWHTFKIVTDGTKVKKEFVSSEIMVLGVNENLPYKDTIDGDDIIRRQVISAYVLLEKDAINGLNKPYIIDFAASSKFGGRKMVSDIKTLNNADLPSFVAYFKLTSHEENFEEHTAFVKNVAFGGYLPKQVMPFLIECRKGLDLIENQIEIDDNDLMEGTATKVDADVSSNVETTEAKI